jgi:hypothetical protein
MIAVGSNTLANSVPALEAQQSFVIAGSGEVPEGKGDYRDYIIRRGETGTEALHEKARWVLGEMERLVHRRGFEPLTPRFVVWCSIQLSYRCLGGAGVRAGARPTALGLS